MKQKRFWGSQNEGPGKGEEFSTSISPALPSTSPPSSPLDFSPPSSPSTSGLEEGEVEEDSGLEENEVEEDEVEGDEVEEDKVEEVPGESTLKGRGMGSRPQVLLFLSARPGALHGVPSIRIILASLDSDFCSSFLNSSILGGAGIALVSAG